MAAERDGLVVIGGGQAGAQLIEVAREHGYAGPITLVSDEPTPPYQRPPLSKQYLTGNYDSDWLLYRPREFYARHGVTLRLGRTATAIDRDRGRVTLDDGTALAYGRLALVTGARARPLAIPGIDHDHVFFVRTLGDVTRLRSRLGAAGRVVIVGGGFIGLETAAALVQRGRDVTVIAQERRLLHRVLSDEMSAFLIEYHERRGVSFHAQTVAQIEAYDDGSVDVVCADSSRHRADVVIVGVGAIPNTEIAEEAGLDCDDGIVVDEFARTTDERIVAAGDCTNHPNPLVGRRLRLETVHNAVEQGRTAGVTVAGAIGEPYAQAPWVWSDQYRLRVQSVGVLDGFDRTVTRGDRDALSLEHGRCFSTFYYREHQLLGVTTINQPTIFAATRRILNHGGQLGPAQAGDESFNLYEAVPEQPQMRFETPWVIRRRGKSAWAWGHS